MPEGPKTLAIVPARRGSKRFPGKNTHVLAGKPLIQWTLEATAACRSIDEVLVTSDDPAVLDLARSLGATHIVERPAVLATDEASTSSVILHALEQVPAAPDVLCLLQPTSPLRTSADIEGALEVFHHSDERPVVSVCEVDHPLAWCNTLAEGGSMIHFARTLEREPGRGMIHHRINGAVYLSRRDEFVAHSTFLTERTVAYVMPRSRSVDIDDELDMILAEALLRGPR